ncbi:NDP-sugar synthase, partial [Candidatus Bathyarchaeota archaeon]|nr:NDP-sugar synthase [Candidatus Bathyarchaeota archaeon]
QRYGKSKNNIEILYSIEKKPMLTGGAIKYAEELIGHEEPFLVLNGDILTRVDFNSLIKKHKENIAIATIALYRVEDPSRYGTVKLVGDNEITKFIEKAPPGKSPSNLINAGVYVLDPKIFKYIPAGRPVSIEREVFPVLAKEKKLFGFEFSEIWIDIGKPADYLKANKVLFDSETKKRFIGEDVNLEENLEFHDPVMIGKKVNIGQNSKLGPYAIIGKGTILGKNVIIQNSVIFPNVTIGDNVTIIDAIIGEFSNIGDNVRISEGCLIGDYATINNNITISRNVTICHSKKISENIPVDKRII